MKAIGVVVFAVLCSLASSAPAWAWGHQGHETVGAIADSLLKGTHAGTQVKAILGTEGLRTAALWADCAKGVAHNKTTGVFHYAVSSKYPECKPFETAAGQLAMTAFVQRNFDACHPGPDDEDCHKQYHYADVAIERPGYDRTDVGTSDHDVVSAIQAAVVVLQGGTAPAPFDIANKKEALRILAHYVGDVHQPLHVGAIYLSTTGSEIDPDGHPLDPATKTRGGNQLVIGPMHQLHGEWDAIPTSLTVTKFRTAGVAAAKLVPATGGAVETWPAQWASETVVASHTVFSGLSFGAEVSPGTKSQHWPTTEPAGYSTTRTALQKQQIIKAGARLAQALEAVWP
jgi:hypothetical protein